jgi:ethanolamine permease
MISFFRLRKSEPDMERPFKVPMYPLFPAVALIIATVSIIAMTYYNQQLALGFAGLMIGSFGIYKVIYANR